MSFTLYHLLASIVIVSAMLTLMMPFIGSMLPGNNATKINQTAFSELQTFNRSIYGNLNRTLIGKCGASNNSVGQNCTGSFFASVTLFTGLAFVINGFGSMAMSILNVPITFVTLIQLGLGYLPISGGVVSILATALTEFLVIFLLVLLLSSWMKYNLNGS